MISLDTAIEMVDLSNRTEVISGDEQEQEERRGFLNLKIIENANLKKETHSYIFLSCSLLLYVSFTIYYLSTLDYNLYVYIFIPLYILIISLYILVQVLNEKYELPFSLFSLETVILIITVILTSLFVNFIELIVNDNMFYPKLFSLFLYAFPVIIELFMIIGFYFKLDFYDERTYILLAFSFSSLSLFIFLSFQIESYKKPYFYIYYCMSTLFYCIYVIYRKYKPSQNFQFKYDIFCGLILYSLFIYFWHMTQKINSLETTRIVP